MIKNIFAVVFAVPVFCLVLIGMSVYLVWFGLKGGFKFMDHWINENFTNG